MTRTIYVDYPSTFEAFKSVLEGYDKSTKNFPKINAYIEYAEKDSDEKDKAILEVSLAGYDPKAIDISIDSTNSTITFSYSGKEEKDNKNREYALRELKNSHFERTFQITNWVDLNSKRYTFENGILKIEFDFKSDEAMGISKIEL